MKKTANQIEIDKACVQAMLSTNSSEAQKGFSQLYKRHSNAIFYSILKHVEDKNVAEDLTQEVFAKIFERIKQYNPDYAFSTWAYKIARNVIIDHKRKEKVEVLSIEGMNSEQGSEDKGAHNNHELLVRSERHNIVHRALDNLKNDDAKRVMKLLYLREKKYKEVAKFLGMPEGTVKALSVRAKREMLAYLQNPALDFEYGRVRTTKCVEVKEEVEEEEFA